MRKNSRHAERGNVLFYVLIAVVLLAALSFAVAQSGRGNVQQLSEDRAGLFASEILEFSNNVANAVAQLKLRGCSEDEISFENAIITGTYTHTPAASDDCKVFHPSGGGINYAKPDSDWLNSSFVAQFGYGDYIFSATQVAKTGAGGYEVGASTGEDLVMFLPFLDQTLCEAINTKLEGGTINTEDDAAFSTAAGDVFDGTYDAAPALTLDAGTEINNVSYGCFIGPTATSAGAYNFYKVLIAR